MDYRSYLSYGSMDKENIHSYTNLQDCRLYDKVCSKMSGRRRSKNSKRRSRRRNEGAVTTKRPRSYYQNQIQHSATQFFPTERNKMFAAKLIFYTLRNLQCKIAWKKMKTSQNMVTFRKKFDSDVDKSFS